MYMEHVFFNMHPPLSLFFYFFLIVIPTGYHEEKIRKKFGVSLYAMQEELGFTLHMEKH